MTLRTEFEFVLPLGFVDENGGVHRRGVMRRATGRDEFGPLRDPTINGQDDPRLTILMLASTVERLGTITAVTEREVGELFVADLAYLQDFYGAINFGTPADVAELLARQREFEAQEVTLRTEFEFVLPLGYVDHHGVAQHRGIMHRATGLDEIEPLRDPTVSGPDDPRLTVLVLARTVDTLGTMTLVTPHEIEGLFVADLAYLQDFYGVINFGTPDDIAEQLERQGEFAAMTATRESIEAAEPDAEDESGVDESEVDAAEVDAPEREVSESEGGGEGEVSHEPGSPLAFESTTKGRRSSIQEVSSGGR